MSGFGRRLLNSIRDAVTSGIQGLQISPLPGQAALAGQLAEARSDLNEGRAQEVVNRLEASTGALVLLLSATSATLGSAYDKLSREKERDKAFRDAVNLFKMTAAAPSPAEIVAVVPALDARGKQAQAIKALREVAAEYPEDISVAHLLATELEATGDPEAASAYAEAAHRMRAGDVTQQVRYLKRATELDPGNAELQASLGTALLRAGDPEAAAEVLQAATPRLRRDHDANVSLAEAQRRTGHPAEALELINAIITEHGDQVATLLVRADIHTDLNQPELALRDLDQVLDVSPGSVSAQRARAELLVQIGRYPEAIRALDEVIASTPEDGEAVLARARARYAERDFVAAAADFADAAKLADVAGNTPMAVTALSWRGETLRVLHQYREALSALDKALAIGPPSAFALGTRGQVLTALGRPVQGRAALVAAAEADPGLAWVHAALADAYRLEGQWERALVELDLADQSGSTAYTHYIHGQILSAMGRDREAADQLRQAWVLDAGPGIAEALSSILGRLGTQTDLEESLAVIDRALAMQPSAVSLLARRSDTLRMLGRHVEALAAADQILSDNGSTDVSGLKALILADLGRANEALKLADEILAIEAGNLFAQCARIEALVVLRRYDDALTDTDSMLARIPGDFFAITMQATILCNIGRFEEALRVVAPLLERTPGQPLLNAFAGYALRRRTPPDLVASAEHMQRALDGEPREAWYQVELADTFDGLDRAEEARRIRQQVLDQTPTGSHVTARRLAFSGWAALFIDRADEAAALLSESVQLDPEDLPLRFALALALLHTGQDELAIDEYAATVRLAGHLSSEEYRKTIIREALSDLRRARQRGGLDPVQLAADETESQLRVALSDK